MRRRLAAFVLGAALAAFAAPSLAAFTVHFDPMAVDVAARLAVLTGTLTKEQKLEKSRLMALSKTLRTKSTSLASDLKIAASAAKRVEKTYFADATLPGEMGAALAGLHTEVLAARDALATKIGLPVTDATAASAQDLIRADQFLQDFGNETNTVAKALDLKRAFAAVQKGERDIPPPPPPAAGEWTIEGTLFEVFVLQADSSYPTTYPAQQLSWTNALTFNADHTFTWAISGAGFQTINVNGRWTNSGTLWGFEMKKIAKSASYAYGPTTTCNYAFGYWGWTQNSDGSQTLGWQVDATLNFQSTQGIVVGRCRWEMQGRR